jgi:hypothetical protein
MNPQGPRLSGSSLEKIVAGKNFDNGMGIHIHLGTFILKSPNLGFAARYTGTAYPSRSDGVEEMVAKAFPGFASTITNRRWYLGNLQIGLIYSVPGENWSMDMELFYGRSAIHVPLFVADIMRGDKHYGYILRTPQTIRFSSFAPVIGLRRSLPENTYFAMRAELLMGKSSGEQITYQLFPDKASFEPGTPATLTTFNRYTLPFLTIGIGAIIQ